MHETMPNRSGQDTPVFDLDVLVTIVETAAKQGFAITDNDRSVMDHARHTYTDNGVDDVHEIYGRGVSVPLYMRSLAARALLYRL